MFRLLVEMCVIRSPDLNDFPLLVIPKIIKSKKLGQPIETLPSPTDEREDVILGIATDIHLGVMRAGGLVRSHLFSFLFTIKIKSLCRFLSVFLL